MGGRWDEVEPDVSGDDGQLGGVTAPVARSVRRVSEDAYEETTRKLAALMVRKACNQGQHSGDPAVCTDPNHRRDAAYMEFCLRALDLPLSMPVVTQEEREVWLRGVRQYGATDVSDLESAGEVA